MDVNYISLRDFKITFLREQQSYEAPSFEVRMLSVLTQTKLGGLFSIS